MLGRSASRLWSKFETTITDLSNDIFKQLRLWHWSQHTKIFITLTVVIAPVIFILIATIAKTIAFIYNFSTKQYYDRKLSNLESYEQEVLRQMEIV